MAHGNRHFLYCLLACIIFSTVSLGQDIKCDNVVIDKDTVTIKIFTYEYPATEEQFTYLLNKIGDEIKFKEDSLDELEFWLYVSIINDFNTYENFKQAFEKLISQMNCWLRDKYGQYIR